MQRYFANRFWGGVLLVKLELIPRYPLLWRLRAALLVPMITSLAIGCYCALKGELLTIPLSPIADTIGIRHWGFFWLSVTALCVVASVYDSTRLVRLALWWSSVVVFSLLGCLIADWWVEGTFWPLTTGLTFGYLGFHFTLVVQPLSDVVIEPKE